MTLQESGEMYLETIYVLSKEKDSVRAIDVCTHMGYSKPSVSRAVGLLKQGGYITVEPNGCIALTELGESIAKKTYECHRTLTEFFKRIGVNGEIAALDACRIEHCISDETLAAIKEHLERI